MEAVSTAAGIFNIASFAVGSGPEAVSRLNKALSMEEKYTEAQKHAAVVLETLETWGEYITRNEKDQLKSAYWQ
jgi:predicted metal-dependent HD superfamily phosphohydrolase